MIVMGPHPIRGTARESAGSVGFSVRMRSSVPVLSVHAGHGPLALCADDLPCDPPLEGSIAGDARYAWHAA